MFNRNNGRSAAMWNRDLEFTQQVSQGRSPVHQHKLGSELLSLVNEIIPLAELAISNEFTADDRYELREQINGGWGIFQAANLISGLRDEKSRQTFLESGECTRDRRSRDVLLKEGTKGLPFLIKSLISFAEIAISEKFTVEDRTKMRTPEENEKALVVASNLLNGLCSESSREYFLNPKYSSLQ
jgi:hypothetical protein